MGNSCDRLKVLIFIPSYNAKNTIVSVLDRIPQSLQGEYDVEVLVADDGSKDNTYALAKEHLANFWCPGKALHNPVNQGYGGNQKLGYHYASKHGFDVVVMVHGDGQYAPEFLPEILAPFNSGAEHVDAVFGSRMLHKRDALKGGMPYYKFVGNMILTRMQNMLLGTRLSEFHTGYRAYRVASLEKLPLQLNTRDFHFDTEIIVQMLFSGGKIVECPITTFYGDEVCHVNGLRYAWDVVKTTVKAKLVRMGIFYDPKFFFSATEVASKISRFAFPSTSRLVSDLVRPGSTVLDLGCSDTSIGSYLEKEKQCVLYRCDTDLDVALPTVPWENIDYVLALDVVEQRNSPEAFLRQCSEALRYNDHAVIMVSAANVGFFIPRLMHLIGQFNYSKRGILALDHKRLFTRHSIKRLFRYAGYEIVQMHVLPAPYPLALGLNWFSRLLLKINHCLCKLLPGLFAWQFLLQVRHSPSVEFVLQNAESHDAQ